MPDKKKLGLPLAVVIVDQVFKAWLMQSGRGVLNQGGVWGLLPGYGWVVVTGMVWLLLVYYYLRASGKYRWGWGLIVGAGLTNLIDRLMFGAVRDFIYYPILNVYGNIADIILGVGVGGIIWQWRHKDNR